MVINCTLYIFKVSRTTELSVKEERRAKNATKLASSLGDGDSLLFVRLGFAHPWVPAATSEELNFEARAHVDDEVGTVSGGPGRVLDSR